MEGWVKGPGEARTAWGEPCITVSVPEGRWRIQADFVLRDGLPTIVDLRIHVPVPGVGAFKGERVNVEDVPGLPDLRLAMAEAAQRVGAGIDFRVLGGVKLGALRHEVDSAWRELLAAGFDAFAGRAIPPVDQRVQQGKPLTDDQKADIAALYLDNLNRPDVNEAIAQILRDRGFADASAALVRDRVRIARRDGWLLPRKSTKGKRQGKPSAKLTRWLERQED
jgi:hypothetical protein